jgi:hypothetical protein
MGIYVLWVVTCYFRPYEPLTIKGQDLQRPVLGVSSRWNVLLYPESRPLRSKVYAANDSVELWCPWCPMLATTALALSQTPKDDFVFPFSYADFLVQFKLSKQLTTLDRHLPTMVSYQGRHSGPSIDAAGQHRTKREIQDRGRWASPKSVDRCERRARLAASYNKLPTALQTHARRCEELLGAMLLGHVQPEELVVPQTLAWARGLTVASIFAICILELVESGAVCAVGVFLWLAMKYCWALNLISPSPRTSRAFDRTPRIAKCMEL